MTLSDLKNLAIVMAIISGVVGFLFLLATALHDGRLARIEQEERIRMEVRLETLPPCYRTGQELP